LSTTPLRLKGE